MTINGSQVEKARAVCATVGIPGLGGLAVYVLWEISHKLDVLSSQVLGLRELILSR